MAQQTALEWLINEWPVLESNILPRIIEQAKAMEKEQVVNAFDTGCTDENRIGKEYYNETYGK
jgi:hypothetical protein